ncbi:unnamed protein product [Peniophora sp. CBMAI 1063]|nr:unnamed protein product [Peniophora sp. CBMAI 1063]
MYIMSARRRVDREPPEEAPRRPPPRNHYNCPERLHHVWSTRLKAYSSFGDRRPAFNPYNPSACWLHGAASFKKVAIGDGIVRSRWRWARV